MTDTASHDVAANAAEPASRSFICEELRGLAESLGGACATLDHELDGLGKTNAGLDSIHSTLQAAMQRIDRLLAAIGE